MYACSFIGTVRELDSHVRAARRATHVTASPKTELRLAAAESSVLDLFDLLEPYPTPEVGVGPPTPVADALLQVLGKIWIGGRPAADAVPRETLSMLVDHGHVEVVNGVVTVPVGAAGPAAHSALVVLSELVDALDGVAAVCRSLTMRADADPEPRSSEVAASWGALADAVEDIAAYCTRLRSVAIELAEHTATVERLTSASTPDRHTEGGYQ